MGGGFWATDDLVWADNLWWATTLGGRRRLVGARQSSVGDEI